MVGSRGKRLREVLCRIRSHTERQDSRVETTNLSSSLSPQRLNRICGSLHRFVLPYVDGEPSKDDELIVHAPVPRTVCRQLRCPPLGVVLRRGVVLGAPVPEATIHEDSHLRPRENDIWRTREALDAHSEAEPASMKLMPKRYLGLGVPPWHPRELATHVVVERGWACPYHSLSVSPTRLQ